MTASLAEHPAPERDDHVHLLGDRHERAREDEAALRVLPAHEGLDPEHVPAGQVER